MTRLALLLGALALVVTGCGTTAAPDRAAPAAAVPSLLVAAAGDISCEPPYVVSGNRCRMAATARLAKTTKPAQVVFALGDTQYEEGTYWQFMNSYNKSWGQLKARTFPVVGNHEYRDPGARGYYRYFAGRAPAHPGYYSKVFNGWRAFFLNSNCDRVDCAAQRAWLGRAMTNYPTKCSMIVMHHPRYSSGEHGNAPEAVGFWDVALRHRVDVALAGHDHDYERFARMGNTGAGSSTGIVSYVVGTGGKNLYPRASNKPGSRFFHNSRHGLLYLSLRPGSWTWEFRTIDNAVLDSGTGSCV